MTVRNEIGAPSVSFDFHRAHHGLHHGSAGRKLTQRLAHLRQILGSHRGGDLAAQAGEEAKLYHYAGLTLIVLVDVRRGCMELLLTHGYVSGDEDPLPRHSHLVEIEDGVVLVESARQRIIENRSGGKLVGFPRQDLQTLGVDRYGKGKG